MRLRNPAVAIVLAASAMIPVVAASPASAVGAGSIAFHCNSTLEWPAVANGGRCGNDLPASAHVNVAGQDTSGGEYVVAGPGRFSALFTYSAACVASAPPLVAAFDGTAVVNGVPAVHGENTTTATVTFPFTWTVAGGGGPMLTGGWTIQFADGGSATVAGGPGAATFLPLLGQNNICPGTGGPVRALIQGEVNAAG